MPYALSLLAGAALPLAFAPFGQFWIAPLSYAVLLYFWKNAAGPRASASARIGRSSRCGSSAARRSRSRCS
jgi:apolipoprotein N-acyltransferase